MRLCDADGAVRRQQKRLAQPQRTLGDDAHSEGIWGALRVSAYHTCRGVRAARAQRRRDAQGALRTQAPARRRHCRRAAHLSARCARAVECGTWRAARRAFERCAQRRAQAAPCARQPLAPAARCACAPRRYALCARSGSARARAGCVLHCCLFRYLGSHVLLGLLAAPRSTHTGARSCAGGRRRRGSIQRRQSHAASVRGSAEEGEARPNGSPHLQMP